jgi:hypothetical protein
VLDECAVSHVDLLSIDVEGAEMDVLAGLDLARHPPRVIVAENCKGLLGGDTVRQYLQEHGYRFYARIWTTDDVFVRGSAILPT